MSSEEAIKELKKCSDTQFNPELVQLVEDGAFSSIAVNDNNLVSSEVMN